MKRTLFTSLLLLGSLSLQAQKNEIWFDEPCSLKGQQCWWGGHPERYSTTNKPISAGDGAVNADHEWEYRSLPSGGAGYTGRMVCR